MRAQPQSRDPSLPSVSVVVPTHERRALLPAVVAPLLEDPATHEVIVVVDGSTDGSLELLERLAAEDPRLVPVFIQNSGLPRARDLGVERATASIVLALDDDVVAAPGLVGGHARRQAEHAGRVVVGYMPVEMPASRRPGLGPTVVYAGTYEAVCRAYEEDPGSILRQLWAGNLSLRREDWLARMSRGEDVISGYHEDQDFGLRCLKAGMIGVFDRSLRASHLYRRSLPAFIRDASASGRNQTLIRDRHADVLLGDPAAEKRPRRRRRVLLARLARSESLGRLTMVGLLVASTCAGWCRAYSLEARAVQLMWNIEFERAAHEARGPARRGEPRHPL